MHSSIVNQTYKNLQVIYRKNQVLSVARNVGLKVATGEYVSFIDSDDWVSINMIEIMLSNFNKFNTDMVVCQFANVFNDGKINSNSLFDKSPLIINSLQAMALLNQLTSTSHVWRKMYRRTLILKNPFLVGKNFEDIYSMSNFIYPCKNSSH